MTPILEKHIPYLLATASHNVSSGFHQKLKQKNVSISDWRILVVANEIELTVNEIAKIVLLNQPTMSKALARLEKNKLISKRRDKGNQRRVWVKLTSKGTEMLSVLLPIALEHEQSCFEKLDNSEREQFIYLLHKVIEINKL